MTNRLILSAMITVALAFSPTLAHSVPTQSVKKKSSSKSQSKVSNKSKSTRKASSSSSYRRSSHRDREDNDVVQSSMTPSYETKASSYEPKAASSPLSETRPLMKVTPQRDGGFLIEPLGPKKKTVSPLTRPSSQPADARRDISSLQTEPKYAKFEPWDFKELVLAQAEYFKGAAYCRGGSFETGYATDCSGFVQYIYHGFKINLPRSSAEQAQVGKTVAQGEMDFSKMLPGDLLFFRRGGNHIGHAGIYLGDGKMIHASNYRNGVIVTNLREPYYQGTFEVAKRVFEVEYPQ